ncbi:hypothetical protein JD844_020147 [Phrynosoma platyrhinos]|uniref:N-alpha-acetyltransferase 60 n=1 Tax=Phrynosoma platyrhinos TaxID=52577 RepID=A0ABQ7TQJ5_PHRPL|nr:hypothetical protein JD844_020147 [Phrynosoma platyrhinos]
MTEDVPPTALSEIYLRLLCHDDIDTVKQLCGDWFPIEYPDSWYRDITSNKKFFSLAATYRGTIVGMIVAEIKSRTKVHKEDGDILASGFPVDTQVAYILSLGVVKEFRKHGIGRSFLPLLQLHHAGVMRLTVASRAANLPCEPIHPCGLGCLLQLRPDCPTSALNVRVAAATAAASRTWGEQHLA